VMGLSPTASFRGIVSDADGSAAHDSVRKLLQCANVAGGCNGAPHKLSATAIRSDV
jgi:hypothetical protein